MGWLVSLLGATLIAVGKAWLFGGLCLLAGATDLVPALGDFGTRANVIVYVGAGFLIMRAGYLVRTGAIAARVRRGMHPIVIRRDTHENRAPVRPVR